MTACSSSAESEYAGANASDGGKGGLVRFGATGTFTFNHCTMAYNIFRKAACAGIRVDGASTTVNVRNSIIWGNFASKSYGNTCGEDVYIANNSSSVKFTNSVLSGTGAPYAYYPVGNGERVTKDDVSICLDPQFATDLAMVAAMSTKSTISTSDPASNGDNCNFKDDADLLSIDVHLKSQAGRWIRPPLTSATWRTTGRLNPRRTGRRRTRASTAIRSRPRRRWSSWVALRGRFR